MVNVWRKFLCLLLGHTPVEIRRTVVALPYVELCEDQRWCMRCYGDL